VKDDLFGPGGAMSHDVFGPGGAVTGRMTAVSEARNTAKPWNFDESVLKQSCSVVWNGLVYMYRIGGNADNCLVTFVLSYISRGSHTPAGADDPWSSIDPTQLLLGICLLRKAFLKIFRRDSPRVIDEILMTFPSWGTGG
jgi:hypothetical protein